MQLVEATVPSSVFLAAILQNSGLDADIQIPWAAGDNYAGSRCRVKAITILSEQNLSWELWFWGTSVKSATRDADSWLGRWVFLNTDGVTETGDPSSSYRYFAHDMDIPIVDLDHVNVPGPPQMHLTLIPRNAGKNINTQIVIKFFLAPEIAWT